VSTPAAGADRPPFQVRTRQLSGGDRIPVEREHADAGRVEAVEDDRVDPGPELRGPTVPPQTSQSKKQMPRRKWRPELERDRSMRAYEQNPRALR
jgi:hypothetical protein